MPKKCPRHILPAVVNFILGIRNRFSIYENLGNLLFSFTLGSSLILVYLISPSFSKDQLILGYSCNLWFALFLFGKTSKSIKFLF